MTKSAVNVSSFRAGDLEAEEEIVLLDSETTGLGEHAEIIQLAYFVFGKENGVVNEYFMPKGKLSYKAMGINKITPEMLEGKQHISPSCTAMTMLSRLNTANNYIVIHNASYDLRMLERAEFKNNMQVIDTYQAALHLLPNAESHALSSLFFERSLYHQLGEQERRLNREFNISLKKIGSHNALYDCVMLQLLYELLLDIAGSNQRLAELSSLPAIIFKPLGFGKYKGSTPEEIVEKDRGYAEWLVNNADNLERNLKHTFLHLLGEG